jgi:hypothetical protein
MRKRPGTNTLYSYFCPLFSYSDSLEMCLYRFLHRLHPLFSFTLPYNHLNCTVELSESYVRSASYP